MVYRVYCQAVHVKEAGDVSVYLGVVSEITPQFMVDCDSLATC